MRRFPPMTTNCPASAGLFTSIITEPRNVIVGVQPLHLYVPGNARALIAARRHADTWPNTPWNPGDAFAFVSTPSAFARESQTEGRAS